MMEHPLTPDEIRALGYEPTPQGWILANPESRPAPHPHLCRGCRKFLGTMADRLCPGCFYFGRGNPHALDQRHKDEVPTFRPPYPEGEDPIEICRACGGYMATGPDRLCDGCAWLDARTSLSFTEWKNAQEEALWRLRRAAS